MACVYEQPQTITNRSNSRPRQIPNDNFFKTSYLKTDERAEKIENYFISINPYNFSLKISLNEAEEEDESFNYNILMLRGTLKDIVDFTNDNRFLLFQLYEDYQADIKIDNNLLLYDKKNNEYHIIKQGQKINFQYYDIKAIFQTSKNTKREMIKNILSFL